MLLRMPEFWLFCYNTIKNNFGISFLNVINLDYFQNLAISIIWGNFNFKYNISLTQKNIRVLRVAGLQNKIVQKGMSIILEQVSEHKFLNCSFGFRRERSAHDALIYLSQNIIPGFWAIEGNIYKWFNRLNSKKITNLIKRKYVSQQVFIDLISKVLKTELVFISRFYFRQINLSIPQNSTVSFILHNIYFHELDIFMIKSTIFTKFQCVQQITVKLNNTQFFKFTKEDRFQGEIIKKNKSKQKMWKYYNKLRIMKIQSVAQKNILCYNQKIIYIRYAAEFIIFGWNTKKECLRVKSLIINFFKGIFDLNFSTKKLKIISLKKTKAQFIGFQIWQFFSYKFINNKKITLVEILKKKLILKIRIVFNKNKLFSNLVIKGLLRLKNGRLFPVSYKPVLRYDVLHIIKYFKITFHEICNYYGFGHNSYDILLIYNYFGRFSAAMTIAHKTKSKISQVFTKYGYLLTVYGSNQKNVQKYGLLTAKKGKNVTRKSFIFFFF